MKSASQHKKFFVQALGKNPSALAIRAESLVIAQAGERCVVPCRNLEVEQSLAERTDYLRSWQEQLTSETGWRLDEIESVAELAEDFSFTYLKELVISSVMKWMQSPDVSFAGVLETHVKLLARQMKTGPEQPKTRNGRPVRR